MKRWVEQLPGLRTAYHRARIFASMSRWYWLADLQRENDRSILRGEWRLDSAETKVRYARVLELVAALRTEGSWGDALELGCAEGFFTQELARRCGSVTACDISPLARSRTAERCAACGNVRVESCDVEHLDASGSFDLVFAMGVLEFIRGRNRFERTASLLARIVRPKGLLILTACRLPKDVRGQKWTMWMGCDGDQMVESFSHQGPWQLVDHEFYPALQVQDSSVVEQVIAVFEKAS